MKCKDYKLLHNVDLFLDDTKFSKNFYKKLQ